MHSNPRETDAPFHHDPRTIFFHWATTFLVLATWVVGLCIDFFPRGDPRVDARSAHFVLGLALAVLIAFRFHWRRSAQASRAPVESNSLHQFLRESMHAGLYALAVLVILLGICNALVRGDSIFGLLSWPTVNFGNKDLRNISEPVHLYAAHVLVAASFLHGVVALLRHYVGKGGLVRMLPARRTP